MMNQSIIKNYLITEQLQPTNISLFVCFMFSAKAPSQLTHLTKHRAEGTAKRPPSQLQKQHSLDDMNSLQTDPPLYSLNSKYSCSADPNQYSSENSSLNKSTAGDQCGRAVKLLDSLDLHSPGSLIIEQTRKRVGEHFMKANIKHTSTLTKRLDQEAVVSSPALAKDSLLLLKPKVYQETMSPKLKKKSLKSKLKSQLHSKSELSRSKPVQARDIPERKRKLSTKNSEPTFGSSPHMHESYSRSPRPLIFTTGQLQAEAERQPSYENTKLTVMELGSDSGDEIMV